MAIDYGSSRTFWVLLGVGFAAAKPYLSSDPQDKNRATPAPAPALGVAGVNVRPDKWWESAVPGWKISRNIMEQN